jgi:ribonuclease P protein component
VSNSSGSIKRLHRLTSPRDFERVFRLGARASSGPVSLVALDAGERRPARAGLAVGGSIGGAVRRNRAKRLLREAVRANCVRPGVDVVLIAKPELPGSSLEDIKASVRAALERAGVAC